MRILFASTVWEPTTINGGPVRVGVALTRELVRRGHHVEVLTSNIATLSPRGFLPARSCPSPSGLVHYLPASAWAAHFSLVRSEALRPWLAGNLQTFDIVHVNFAREWWPFQVAAAARAQGCPSILQSHGNLHRRAIQHRIVDVAFTGKALQGAARLLALQPTEVEQLRRISPAAPITILGNGVPDEYFLSPVRTAELRQPMTLLFVGRLHADKRVLQLIAMIERLLPEFPALQCRIAGPDGGELQRAKSSVDALGLQAHVQFLGALDESELRSEYQRATLLVHPSIRESYGLAVLEAMASGLPVVATTGCALAVEWQSVGAAKIVAPDSDQFMEAVSAMLKSSQKRDQIAVRAYDYVRTSHTVAATVDRLLEIYEVAITRRHMAA